MTHCETKTKISHEVTIKFLDTMVKCYILQKENKKQSAHQEQPRTRRTDLKFIYKTVMRVYKTLFGDHMLCYKHQIIFYVQIKPCEDMGFNEIHNYAVDTLGNDV